MGLARQRFPPCRVCWLDIQIFSRLRKGMTSKSLECTFAITQQYNGMHVRTFLARAGTETVTCDINATSDRFRVSTN